MRKIFVIIAVLIFLVIGVAFFVISRDLKLPLTSEFVVPKYVTVFFALNIERGDRIPVLILSVVAGGDCDSASDLNTKKSISGNSMVIDIEGYKFTKGSFGYCTPSILESRAKISIDAAWLKQSGEKEILFKLGGQENKYKISYNQYRYRVKLSNIQATNVVINKPSYNSSDIHTTLEITLYPTDVVIIYLAGSLSFDKDYTSAMRRFAQSKGFIPAEQVYHGLQQSEKNWLYVVLKNRSMPDPDRAGFLGDLPNEHDVNVYLKQIVNDAEHYQTINLYDN